MHARFMMIAALLTAAPPAFADPAKAPEPQKRPATVVLASADEVRAPAPAADQPAAQPAKRRFARVTSCRCGDPAPESEQQQEQ